MLMSNTGGYPEYDPYRKIVDLSSYRNVEIFLAVTLTSVRDYSQKNPEVVKAMVSSNNVKLYVFENMVPYQYRIGLNTEIMEGFFCSYYGHKSNKVDLEGIATANPLMLDAIETLFMGLLDRGTLVDSTNCFDLLRV